MILSGQRNLRGGVDKVLERGKDGEDPFGNELVIAMTQVVHEINTCDVTQEGCYRGSSGEHCCQHWYCEQHEISHVFCKRVGHSCTT
jgi:hypothetical protein